MNDDKLIETLSTALRRREPRDGFADRVMARLPEQVQVQPGSWWQRFAFVGGTAWAPAMAVLLVAMLVTSLMGYRRAQDHKTKVERARTELAIALQITTAKLEATKLRLIRNKGARVL
ncbi:MAG: hypothetical protein H7039_08120 [Bryobacteraceae bacterium]|nr:hypothetical protein [Bryobacteraceae bacterium]